MKKPTKYKITITDDETTLTIDPVSLRIMHSITANTSKTIIIIANGKPTFESLLLLLINNKIPAIPPNILNNENTTVNIIVEIISPLFN